MRRGGQLCLAEPEVSLLIAYRCPFVSRRRSTVVESVRVVFYKVESASPAPVSAVPEVGRRPLGLARDGLGGGRGISCGAGLAPSTWGSGIAFAANIVWLAVGARGPWHPKSVLFVCAWGSVV